MIFSTNLEAVASGITPSNMIQRLESTGWKLFKTKRKDIAIYQHTTESAFEQVTVPLDKQLSDFSYAMYSATKTISAVEGKPVEQIILELLNPGASIKKIRLAMQNAEFGTIFLNLAKGS